MDLSLTIGMMQQTWIVLGKSLARRMAGALECDRGPWPIIIHRSGYKARVPKSSVKDRPKSINR
jgi:hypothetical protein